MQAHPQKAWLSPDLGNGQQHLLGFQVLSDPLQKRIRHSQIYPVWKCRKTKQQGHKPQNDYPIGQDSRVRQADREHHPSFLSLMFMKTNYQSLLAGAASDIDTK